MTINYVHIPQAAQPEDFVQTPSEASVDPETPEKTKCDRLCRWRYICTAAIVLYILLAYVTFLIFGMANDGVSTFSAWIMLTFVSKEYVNDKCSEF